MVMKMCFLSRYFFSVCGQNWVTDIPPAGRKDGNWVIRIALLGFVNDLGLGTQPLGTKPGFSWQTRMEWIGGKQLSFSKLSHRTSLLTAV